MFFIFYVQYIFFWKLYHLWDNVENYGTARLATHDNQYIAAYKRCALHAG